MNGFTVSRVARGSKENLVERYRKCTKFLGIAFSVPEYGREDNLPFVPLQREVETLIEVSRNLDWKGQRAVHLQGGYSIQEATELVEKGFEFVCDMGTRERVFRKRK